MHDILDRLSFIFYSVAINPGHSIKPARLHEFLTFFSIIVTDAYAAGPTGGTDIVIM